MVADYSLAEINDFEKLQEKKQGAFPKESTLSGVI